VKENLRFIPVTRKTREEYYRYPGPCLSDALEVIARAQSVEAHREYRSQAIVGQILAAAGVKRPSNNYIRTVDQFLDFIDKNGPAPGESDPQWMLRIGMMVPNGKGAYRIGDRFIGAFSNMRRERPDLYRQIMPRQGR
jgi:hypothetical protein